MAYHGSPTYWWGTSWLLQVSTLKSGGGIIPAEVRGQCRPNYMRIPQAVASSGALHAIVPGPVRLSYSSSHVDANLGYPWNGFLRCMHRSQRAVEGQPVSISRVARAIHGGSTVGSPQPSMAQK